MSAISKPLINSTAVIGSDSEAIAIENIVTFSKVSIANPIGSSTPTSQIVFIMKSIDTAPHTVIWKFVDDTARDAEYVKLLALVSTVVV